MIGRAFSLGILGTMLLLGLCLTSACVAAQRQKGGINPSDLQARYDALEDNIRAIQRAGGSIPSERIEKLQASLLAAKKKRDWKRVAELLDQAETQVAQLSSKLAPDAGSPHAATPATSSGGEAAGLVLNQPALPGLRREWSPPATSARPVVGGYFGIGYARLGLATMFSKAGATCTKIPQVAWGALEPSPPRNGRHIYQWGKLDQVVEEYQRAGLDMHMLVKQSNPWAHEKTAKMEGGITPPGLSISSFPAKQHVDGYRAFITALVERYDADGDSDMPGLLRPVNYFEIESEAQHEGYWRGTDEQYAQLLEIAAIAARKANPNVKIILSGVNFGPFLDDAPDAQEMKKRLKSISKFERDSLAFIRYTLKLREHFDIVEFHYNRNLRAAYPTVEWIRGELGRDADSIGIWAGDACSTPWLFEKGGRFGSLPYPDEKLLTDLHESKTNEGTLWFRREQGALTVKRCVLGADAGLSQIIIESGVDIRAYNESRLAADQTWTVAGLIEDDEKTPRPAFYSFQQMTRHLAGFTSVTRLPAAEDVFFYRFDGMPQGPVCVGWSERGSNVSLPLPAGGQRILMEDLQLTSKSSNTWLPVTGGQTTVTLTAHPRYFLTESGRSR